MPYVRWKSRSPPWLRPPGRRRWWIAALGGVGSIAASGGDHRAVATGRSSSRTDHRPGKDRGRKRGTRGRFDVVIESPLAINVPDREGWVEVLSRPADHPLLRFEVQEPSDQAHAWGVDEQGGWGSDARRVGDPIQVGRSGVIEFSVVDSISWWMRFPPCISPESNRVMTWWRRPRERCRPRWSRLVESPLIQSHRTAFESSSMPTPMKCRFSFWSGIDRRLDLREIALANRLIRRRGSPSLVGRRHAWTPPASTHARDRTLGRSEWPLESAGCRPKIDVYRV